ncbi:MAG: alpha/beta fold hydrolase [Aggregatilineales bacterium]
MNSPQKKYEENPDPLVVGATGTGALLVAMLAAVGGWIGYSALRINHAAPLPPAIDAERRAFVSASAGALSYYQDRRASGRPLVLIHSVNAAASSYEMRPLFEQYRGQRPVYALDLPGFGFSDRGRRLYTPALYTNAIIDFMSSQVMGNSKLAADVVALSLGSEFAARAALERLDLFHSLALISPSGFAANKRTGNSPRTGDRRHRMLSFPLWSQAFYDLLVTRRSIRLFLKRSFYGTPDRGLVEYDYLTAHQPGAKNAPLYFVSGKLFSADIFESVYSKLALPVQVLYDRDSFVRFDRLPEIAAQHPNWKLTRIAPTLGLPQFERPDDTKLALDEFWGGLG